MTTQHYVCVNTMLLQQLIINSQRTRGAKYSLPVLMTRLYRNFLPDMEFIAYDRVLVTPKHIISACNSFLHSTWTPTVQLEVFLLSHHQRNKLMRKMSPNFG